jgi:uncharacterized MAPEG superfamily protein
MLFEFPMFFLNPVRPYLDHLPVHFTLEGCIVVMYAIVYFSKYLQIGMSFLLLQNYDNVQGAYKYGPKDEKDRNWRTKAVQRAYAAHCNHWEAFAGFSIAVMLAMLKTPDQRAELTILANAFIHIRILYNAVYVLAFNEPLSYARTAVFFVGWAIIFRIFAIAVAGNLSA